MADLQVSIALLLEQEAEIASKLAAAGGKAGADFARGLSAESQKAFNDFTAKAEKAAKEVGLKFNKVDFSFRTPEGKFVSQEQLQGLAKANQAFKEAVEGANRLKSAISSASADSAKSLNILEAAVTGVAVSLTSKLTDSVTAGLGGLKGLVGGFMELDGELRMAAAAAGETGGYERLGSIVEKVGIDAAGTSKQVAELATSLVRAGFSVSEVEKALPGVVRGAEATGTGFEQMGNIVGNTLRGFGLEAEQVGRVTDVLVNAANSSNASIEGLGYTFEYTAPIAKALGVSLEDVAAAAGLMANAGIQGSVAGTGLRTGLQKLQEAAGGASPAVLGLSHGQERLAQTMKMIGATVTDTAGNLLPLEQVFLNLKEGLSKLSQADQVQLTNILFGDEAGSKFLSITNQSSAAISKMFSDMKNSAGATDVARDAMAGIGLEVQQLEGTLGAIGTSIGGVLAAGLRPFIQAANAMAGVVSGLPEPIKTVGSALIGMAAAATAASVGVGALNVAVASVGGWAAMRTAIASVAAVITGPLGAGVLIFAGLGAAAGVLTGHFRETDRTTKTLLQTAVGLGAFVAVLRGITVAQVAWNNASKVGVTLQTLLTALTPGGLAKVAVAAGVAAGAYYAMGQAISVTGEETTAMADKSKAVKDEIAQLGKEIEQGKKLNVDTSDLEKLKDTKEAELQQIENPLEIKLNIQKAEAQIKSLQEQRDKLGKDTTTSGSGVLTAQIKAAEKYRDVLKAADEGVGGKAFEKLGDSAKKFVQEQDEIKNKIQALRNEQIQLPIDAKVDREKIDKQILDLQNVANKNELKFKASLNVEELQRQLATYLAKKAEAEKGVSKGFGEPDAGFSQRQAANKKEVEGYTRNIAELQRQIAVAENEAVGASEKHATAAKDRVKSAQEIKQAAEEQYTRAKAVAEAENMVATNQQKQIDNAGRLMSLDKSRLESIQKMADAYLNIANAQAGLTQSEFDVGKARNNRDVNVASEELQALRDRKASEGEIAAKEQEIKQLKEDGRQIEKEALAAAIDAAAKRFEMERKILELKQLAAKLDQEAAVRAAQRAEIDDKRQLIDLKVKQQDPNLTADQKAALGEAIALQGESVKLSQAQTAAEKDRLANIDKEFAMEKELLSLKQNTEANQFRAKAAEQGWEGDLSPQLNGLDKAKGKLGQNKTTWDDIAKQADHITGTIAKHNEEIGKGNKKLGDLAKSYKGIGGGADGSKAPEMSSGEKARQEELDRTKKWKKQMEAAGFVELKVEGMPQNVSDAIVGETLTGKKAPEVDAWFASAEGRAAVDKWRSSAQGATDEMGIFEAAAKQAGVSVEDLGKHLEDVGYIELNAGALEVDQQTTESLQKMRDELFGPEAQKRLFTPEGMKGLADFNLKPTVDTTQAQQDLQAFKDQQRQDPVTLGFDSTGLDQVQGDIYNANEAVNAFKANGEGASYDLAAGFANAANSIVPFSNQVDQLGMDLQALNGGGVDPFQGAGQSLAEAAYGAQALVQGLETANQSAAEFDATLAESANADQIQQAYDALQPPDVSQAVSEQGTLAQGTEGTIETTQGLASSWVDVTASINAAATALANYKSQESGGNARFAGGPVLGGHGYTVNELGQESFLSRSGALSLIRAPQYGKWVAPSRGLVIPASMTSQLQSAGAFSRGGGGGQVATALASPTQGRGNQVAALGRLQRSIDRLEKTMGSYRPPDVTVSVPGNAGLLHTLQSIR